MIRVIYLLFLFVLSGCYATSSGVIPFGPDTYTITTDSELGGIGTAKKKALNEANKYCINSGLQMMPVNSNASTQIDFLGDRIPTFEFTFRCLAKGDEGLKRPVPKKEPDIVIK